MKLAYFFPIHRLARQFAWVFSAVYDPDDVFVIHIDRDAPQSFRREIETLIERKPNVHLLDSIPVAWGGWSICEVELRAIRLLVDLNQDWQYLVNLSGQDYPVRPIAEFRNFLAAHQGQNFIRLTALSDAPFHFRRRLFFYCTERNGKLVRMAWPNWPFRPLKIAWFGSQWHFLSRDFCDWIAASGVAQRAKRSLEHVKIPDEFFMQAIAMNSPFRETLNTASWRFIRFAGPSPVVLRAADYDAIAASPTFFARKFDESVDSEILERLADRIGAPVPDGV